MLVLCHGLMIFVAFDMLVLCDGLMIDGTETVKVRPLRRTLVSSA